MSENKNGCAWDGTFRAGDLVIRRGETNARNTGQVTQVKTYISVRWHQTGNVMEMPRESLMPYDAWQEQQEQQKQLKHFWSLTPIEQDNLRGKR